MYFLQLAVPLLQPLQFLRLNTTPGVRQVFLPSEDEGVSDAISPPGGIRMFEEIYDALYVRME